MLLFILSQNIVAQELNARVRINADKIEGSKQALSTLERDLNSFINDRSWTNNKFTSREKIECDFFIVVNEAVSPTSFKGELHVQSKRPVFSSAYSTPMLNYRDNKLSFDYVEHQPLDFDINNLDNSLTSSIAYYVYLILGLDFDSMSLNGGSPYYQIMYSIASSLQAINQNDWGTFADLRSRASFADALNNPIYHDYRAMWYEYHRKGLDEMATNIDTGRKNIVTSLYVIEKLKLSQPNSIIVSLFGDAKLDELIDVLSNGDVSEKKLAAESLQQIFPTKNNQIDRLRK